MEQLPPFSQGLASHSVMMAVSHSSPVYPGGQTQVLLLTQTPVAHEGSQITATSYQHMDESIYMCPRDVYMF
jgi:hypothetical protein